MKIINYYMKLYYIEYQVIEYTYSDRLRVAIDGRGGRL